MAGIRAKTAMTRAIDQVVDGRQAVTQLLRGLNSSVARIEGMDGAKGLVPVMIDRLERVLRGAGPTRATAFLLGD